MSQTLNVDDEGAEMTPALLFTHLERTRDVTREAEREQRRLITWGYENGIPVRVLATCSGLSTRVIYNRLRTWSREMGEPITRKKTTANR